MGRAGKGLGTTISIDAELINNVTEMGGLELSAEMMEVTTLTSAGKDYIPGIKDFGVMTMNGFLEPGDAGQAALKAAYDNQTENTYVITYPAPISATWTFTGLVNKFSTPSVNITEAVPFDVEITVTSATAPVFGTTASTGASAIVVTQVGGAALTALAFSPSFAIGTYNYTVTFTTQTAYAIKVTAASHTIKLYVDGVYSQDLTSGTESASIAQASAGAKLLKAVVYEAGKTPITYNLMVSKIS